MALTNGFVTTAGTTALDARLMEAGRVTLNPDNSVRTGQLYGDSGPVKPTSSMSVTLLGDTIWVLSRGKSDGAIIVANNGDAQLALDPAPSANSRYDAVYLKHNDTEKGDPNSIPVLGKVTGTASASPSVPAVPAGALLIATVLVPAGVTATNASGVVVSNVSQLTSIYGSPIRYRTVAAMNADAVNVTDGFEAYVKGAGIFFLRGNQWIRMDADTFVVTEGTGTFTSTSTTGRNLRTLGPTGTASRYSSSDPTVFPVRTDCVIGPIPFACWVEVKANIQWDFNNTGSRIISITQNDSEPAVPIANWASAVGPTDATITGDMLVAAGDYIKLKAIQDSGSTLGFKMRLSARLKRMN